MGNEKISSQLLFIALLPCGAPYGSRSACDILSLVLMRASDPYYSRYAGHNRHKNNEKCGEPQSRQCNDHSDIHPDYLLNLYLLCCRISDQVSGV